LYEVRDGTDGAQMLYLKPVVSSNGTNFIKGVLLPANSDMPSEAFVFDKLDAGITRPKPVVPAPVAPDVRLLPANKIYPWFCSIL